MTVSFAVMPEVKRAKYRCGVHIDRDQSKRCVPCPHIA
jgi:hypothetical protein